MGIVIRQSLKGTIVGFVGAFVAAINIILLYPYCLSPEIIGLIRVLVDMGILMAFFAQLGMPNVAIKFFPYFKNQDSNHNGFFFLFFILPLLGFVIFAITYLFLQDSILSLFAQNSPILLKYNFYIIPLTFCIIYISLFETYASLFSRIVVPKLIKEILIRLFMAVFIILYFFKFINLNQLIFFIVLSYFVALVINGLYIYFLNPVSLTFNRKTWDYELLKQLFRFILFMLVSGIGMNILNKIDVFLISSKISMSDTGIFSIAYFIGSFIEMPSKSISQILGPITSEAMKKNEWSTVESLYKSTSINQLIIGSFLFILIVANLDNLFAIMPNGHVFEKGKYVIILIGLSKIIDAATSLNNFILGYSKHYINTLYFLLLMGAATLAFNLLLIPYLGINGSALATVLAILCYNALSLFYVYFKMDLQPFGYNTIKVILISLLITGFVSILPTLINPFIDIVFKSIIVSIVYLTLIFKLKVSLELNNFAANTFKKFINKN